MGLAPPCAPVPPCTARVGLSAPGCGWLWAAGRLLAVSAGLAYRWLPHVGSGGCAEVVITEQRSEKCKLVSYSLWQRAFKNRFDCWWVRTLSSSSGRDAAGQVECAEKVQVPPELADNLLSRFGPL